MVVVCWPHSDTWHWLESLLTSRQYWTGCPEIYLKQTHKIDTKGTSHVLANIGQSPNVVSMLGQRRRGWANVETALGEFPMFTGVEAIFTKIKFIFYNLSSTNKTLY